jgi:PDZ domain
MPRLDELSALADDQVMAGYSRFTRGFALAGLSLLVLGCGTPGTPVMQTIRVETPGCVQVSCELTNDRGNWYLGNTPGTVTVTTSQAPLKVVCRTNAGVQGSSATPSAMGAPSGVGAVAGGVAGGAAVSVAVGSKVLLLNPAAGVIATLGGVSVGAATGQAVESDAQVIRYPELITLPMNCTAVGGLVPRTGAAIGLGIRGMPRAEASALGAGDRSAVLVTSVAEGGAAAAAGLRSGDILLAAMGRDLNDAAEFEVQLSTLSPGAPLPLRVWRNGQLMDVMLRRQQVLP